MAKDFSKVNTARVYGAIAEATAEEQAPDAQEVQATQKAPAAQKVQRKRKTYTETEALEFMQSLKTTGRKGVKLPRINLAFKPEVYEYIRIMSQVRGESLTQFVNYVLEKSMTDNAEVYKKAIEFRNSL